MRVLFFQILKIKKCIQVGEATVGPQQSISIEKDLKLSECGYFRVLPYEIEKCETIQSTRISYKDESKERFVTKYGTLFQQWTSNN